jgi:4-amino-4-deoxy-L-arabinose transferase-like glycosyltransferase
MTPLFWSLTAALIVCRFYQFRPYLDHPHLFRQAETAFYSLGFYRFGFNVFSPSVGWLGGYRRAILEFPLTEWISACVYLITGPTILVDRLVTLAFFLGSAFFLFRIVKLVCDRLMAQIATLLYMAAPLGIYYSRAVHVDFTAVCFTHAFFYWTLRFIESRQARTLLAAVIAGILAFIIKAPYVFYLIVPILWFCYERRVDLKTLVLVAFAFAVPGVAFLSWFSYSQRVNAQAPDLSFIPSYFMQVNRFGWFFGTWSDRLRLDLWQTVIGRVYREIAATVWWILAPIGLLTSRRFDRYYSFTISWTLGTLIYLIIFLTLNADHSYYQIPFIAPFCLWLAPAIYRSWTEAPPLGRWGRPVAAATLIAFAASSMYITTRRFYRIDPLQLAIGHFIETNSDPDDLIVMAHTDAKFADPSFLFYAHRYGWSVGPDELSARVIEGLKPHGATAVVTSTFWPPSSQVQPYLETLPVDKTLNIDGGLVTIRRLAPRPSRP